MTEDLVIFGCGGHGRELASAVAAVNAASPTWNVLGFVDDDPRPHDLERVRRLGLRVLGALDEVAAGLGAAHYLVGIGAGPVRERVVDRVAGSTLRAATLIHPTAAIGLDVEIGEGSTILQGAVVTTNVRIGRHVTVSYNSVICHDCVVHDFATVSGAVLLSGGTTLGERATVYVGAMTIPLVTVGADAVVGAGACVIRDVPAGVTVRGVPAR